ncbi:MAG: hypothetical protein IIV90_03020 [Oscillospiraceae bacterium]|nr:hypothetical protein [Oscillospiraceae bacterium]
MMIMPSKEELRAYEEIRPWKRFDMESMSMVLRDDAPAHIVELCRKYFPLMLVKD